MNKKMLADKKSMELYEKVGSYKNKLDFMKRREMGSDLYALSLIWNDLSSGMKKIITEALAGHKDSSAFDKAISELATNIDELDKACDDIKVTTDNINK
jgi:hypothetical protein